jgi:ArsR family transcriptional regulator
MDACFSKHSLSFKFSLPPREWRAGKFTAASPCSSTTTARMPIAGRKSVAIANPIVTINLVMSSIVTFTRALADPTRWRIVRMVRNEALCVCELADILDMPQSSVSSHVQIIRKAGLLESEKCEKWTYFRIEAKYLKVIQAMENLFTEGDSNAWNEDETKMMKRLEERLGSCCPGPKKLASRKRTNTQRSSAP